VTQARSFHLGDILTVTTGRLVSPRHMDAVYDLLNFMTGDNLFTHQLPRAMDECQPHLLAQHPDLATVVVPDDFGVFGVSAEVAIADWLAGQVVQFGVSRDVAPLAAGEHTAIDPLAELAMNHPYVKVIPVVLPEADR
jgi:hypothetical protein